MRLLWLLPLLALSAAADAQVGLPFPGPGMVSGGGGCSGICLVSHVQSVVGNTSSVTTSPGIDTTGANLIVVNVTGFNLGGGSQTLTDNKSNTTYVALSQAGSGTCHNNLWYILSPTVGSGHTFTYNSGGSSIFGTIQVAAFSGAVPSFDRETTNSNSSPATTIQPGSITPGNNNEVVMTGVCFSDDAGSSTYTINGSYTITDFIGFATGNNEGGGLAYLVQTSAAATNPTWTDSSSATTQTASIAAFR